MILWNMCIPRFMKISDDNLTSILSALKNNDSSVILLSSLGGVKGDNNESLSLDEIITSISMFDKKIVISMEDSYLFDGVLGGYVTSSYLQGETAAKLLKAHLNGASMKSLEPILNSPNQYMFNDNELFKLDIKLPSKLFEVSKIINPRVSFFQHNENIIWTIIVYLVVSIVLLAFFYFFSVSLKNKQLNKANMDIKNLASKLESDVLERTKELKEAQLKSELANKSKSEFLANMSHELYTPMHGILSYSTLGMEKSRISTPGKNFKYFNNIKVSGERLMQLLTSLLDMAKLDSDKVVLNYKTHNLKEISEDCIDEIKDKLIEKDLDVFFSSGEFAGEAEFDRHEIQQVIKYLLTNAIKYSPAEGCIDIFIKPVQLNSSINEKDCVDGLLFSIRDYGPGFSLNEIDLVFDKFMQGSDTVLSASKGTGLGLPISKKIIDLHNGRIWANNHPDAGAIISFVLPVNREIH